mgnify:CR=1 FL=1
MKKGSVGVWIGALLVVISIILIGYYYSIGTNNGSGGNNGGDNGNYVPPDADIQYIHLSSDTVVTGDFVNINTKIKNLGSETNTYMIEAGIIPKRVAQEWNLLSILPMSSYASIDCCTGQENIKDVYVTVDGFSSSDEITLTVRSPYPTIVDKCGSTDYWDGCLGIGGREYIAYVIVANHCNWKDGIQQPGYTMYDYKTKIIKITCW